MNFGKNSFGDEKQSYNEELIKGIRAKYQEYIQMNSEAYKVNINIYL